MVLIEEPPKEATPNREKRHAHFSRLPLPGRKNPLCPLGQRRPEGSQLATRGFQCGLAVAAREARLRSGKSEEFEHGSRAGEKREAEGTFISAAPGGPEKPTFPTPSVSLDSRAAGTNAPLTGQSMARRMAPASGCSNTYGLNR